MQFRWILFLTWSSFIILLPEWADFRWLFFVLDSEASSIPGTGIRGSSLLPFIVWTLAACRESRWQRKVRVRALIISLHCTISNKPIHFSMLQCTDLNKEENHTTLLHEYTYCWFQIFRNVINFIQWQPTSSIKANLATENETHILKMQRSIKLSSGEEEDDLPAAVSLLGVYGCSALFSFLFSNIMKGISTFQHHAHSFCAFWLNSTAVESINSLNEVRCHIYSFFLFCFLSISAGMLKGQVLPAHY